MAEPARRDGDNHHRWTRDLNRMPSATTVPPHLELLTFLSDPNAKVRQVALSNLVGYSAKTSPQRSLLTDKHKGLDGKPLQGRNGRNVDTIEDLKRLCEDQPMVAHDAFCALINLSESLLVARRMGDRDFLSFLVRYIADPVSLLTDLACMLLSNLTKLESIGATLLSLELPARPLHSFMSSQDAQATVEAMNADPEDPEFEAKKARAKAHNEKLRALAEQGDRLVPAMAMLVDAFEEGADVTSAKSQSASIEEMRTRAREIQQQQDIPEDADKPKEELQLDENGRPVVRRKSNCNFLASVFANVTTVPKGRDFFVSRHAATGAEAAASVMTGGSSDTLLGKEFPIARIAIYTEHPDLIRRGGTVSTIKNVLFVKSAHQILISPGSESAPENTGKSVIASGSAHPVRTVESNVDILPNILLPLCDGRELAKLDLEDQDMLPDECQLMDEDKRREADSALRLMLVESLLLLCTTLYGRQCLRARGAYIVVREAHLEEKDEKVAEAVVRLVNILKRDESESTLRDDGTAEEEEVGAEGVEENQVEDEESDEDLVIEEL